MAEQTITQFRLRLVVVVLSIAMVVGLFALPFNMGWRRELVIEGLITAAVLLLLLTHRGILVCIMRMSIAYRVIGLLLLTLCLAGQWIQKPNHTYPFVLWGMYSSRSDAAADIVVSSIELTRRDGQVETLVPRDFVLTPRAFQNLVIDAGNEALKARITHVDQWSGSPRDLLLYLVDLQNQRHTSNPVVDVKAVQYVIHLGNYKDKTSIVRSELWEVRIE